MSSKMSNATLKYNASTSYGFI